MHAPILMPGFHLRRRPTSRTARLYHKATMCGAASTPTTLDTCVHLNYILRKCEPAARPTDPARSDSRMSMAALRRNSRTVADPLSAGRCDDDDRQYHQTSPGVIRVTDNIYSDQPALRHWRRPSTTARLTPTKIYTTRIL